MIAVRATPSSFALSAPKTEHPSFWRVGSARGPCDASKDPEMTKRFLGNFFFPISTQFFFPRRGRAR